MHLSRFLARRRSYCLYLLAGGWAQIWGTTFVETCRVFATLAPLPFWPGFLDAVRRSVSCFFASDAGRKSESRIPCSRSCYQELTHQPVSAISGSRLASSNSSNSRLIFWSVPLHGRDPGLNRIMLLTANEGLSKQHLGEFELSGIQAELFSKEGRGLFAGRSVEIIDVHKLKEEMGEKRSPSTPSTATTLSSWTKDIAALRAKIGWREGVTTAENGEMTVLPRVD